MRRRTPLTVGLALAGAAALAGGAAAHGGGHGGGGHDRSPLQLRVSGTVTALTQASGADPASVTVSPGGSLDPWTCALPAGADTTGITAGTTAVRMTCWDVGGVLTATRLRPDDDGDAPAGGVRVRATGLVTAFTAFTPSTAAGAPPLQLLEHRGRPPVVDGTAGSITVDPGDGAPTVTCDVTGRTRVRTEPVAGTDSASIECRSRADALVAKRIRVRAARPAPAIPSQGGGTD